MQGWVPSLCLATFVYRSRDSGSAGFLVLTGEETSEVLWGMAAKESKRKRKKRRTREDKAIKMQLTDYAKAPVQVRI